jgi:hypothetical protein
VGDTHLEAFEPLGVDVLGRVGDGELEVIENLQELAGDGFPAELDEVRAFLDARFLWFSKSA